MTQAIRKYIGKAGYVLLSTLLAFHVFSVFMAPAAMPPASPLLMDGYRITVPYTELMFLNHGYHFFAPDPGASSLISWKVTRSGDVPVSGRFPDPSTRPRLLYHRYFMLAENVSSFPEETQNEVLKAYARHFAKRHSGDSVTLTRVYHEPSSISRILAGGRLSDPATFSEELIDRYQFNQTTTSSASLEY